MTLSLTVSDSLLASAPDALAGQGAQRLIPTFIAEHFRTSLSSGGPGQPRHATTHS